MKTLYDRFMNIEFSVTTWIIGAFFLGLTIGSIVTLGGIYLGLQSR